MALDRKNNPLTIPAVAPSAIDAHFFARLRVISDEAFLIALTNSAVRGQAQEVMAGLSALRADQYEPLLWHDFESTITLSCHPLDRDKYSSKIFTGVKNAWDAVALALKVDQRPWDSPLEGSMTYHAEDEGRAQGAPLTPEKEDLLRAALALCERQCARTYRDEGERVVHHSTYTTSTDGMGSWYGSEPWLKLFEALQSTNSCWDDMRRVLDAIPQEVLDNNSRTYHAFFAEMASRDTPVALALLERLSNGAMEINPALLGALAGSLTHHGEELRSQRADALLEIADLLASGRSYEEGKTVFLIDLLSTVIAYQPVAKTPDAPARRVVDGLLVRLDARLCTAPNSRWMTGDGSPKSYQALDRSLTNLLGESIRSHYAEIVDRLADHWARDPRQVSLLRITSRLTSKVALPEGAVRGVQRIIEAARHAGIDLNQQIEGTEWHFQTSTPSKPGFLLHTVAKALVDHEDQLAILTSAVLAGADPTLANKSGHRVQRFISAADRPAWDEMVASWKTRNAVHRIFDKIEAGDLGKSKKAVRR